MTRTAMAKPFDQIGAAGDHGIGIGRNFERTRISKEKLPVGERPAQVGRPWQGAGLVILLDRLHLRHEESIKRFHVLIIHDRIGDERHCRIKMDIIPPHPLPHRTLEIGIAIAADTGFAVRRDVGGVNRAKRRLHAEPARKSLAPGAVWQAAQSPA